MTKNSDLESVLNSWTLSSQKEELRYVCDSSYNDVFKHLTSQLYQSHTLKKIEPEKCSLEIIVTYNLRLRKCPRHKLVSKNKLRHICDFCLLLRMC